MAAPIPWSKLVSSLSVGSEVRWRTLLADGEEGLGDDDS